MRAIGVLGQFVACAVVVAAGVSLSACGGDRRGGPPPGWEFLGERAVNWRVDRDVIPVTASEGRFTAVQLRVRGNGVHILDLKVHFGNGGTQDVAIRSHIPAGGHTRVIDLNGGPRVIRKITMVYKTAGARAGRAVVRAWGKHP
jgi:hypothetical protein